MAEGFRDIQGLSGIWFAADSQTGFVSLLGLVGVWFGGAKSGAAVSTVPQRLKMRIARGLGI